MDQSIQTAAPIIPVLDVSLLAPSSYRHTDKNGYPLQERLNYIPNAPREHNAKIDQYNELLEDIYQREVELTRVKSALVDMRQELTDEVQHLSSTGVLPPVVSVEARSESESDDAGSVLSDSSGSGSARRNSIGKPFGKGKKVKGKFGRLGNRHSKVPDAQLDAEWDYELEIGRTGKKGRRGSDSSIRNVV